MTGSRCGIENKKTCGKDCLFKESVDSKMFRTENKQEISIDMSLNL